MTNPILIKIFSFIYRKWLFSGEKVIKIKGWRTALVETKGKDRKTCTFLFFFEKR